MMATVVSVVERLKGERGQALAEYSLILAFVAMVCILALGSLGLAIAGHIDSFAVAFP
jgi:Flp pilus assembly pilin Flp